MRTADFDYPLPEALIAQRPLPRGEARLLVVGEEGAARHRTVAELPRLLAAGDLLVVNDTEVIPARLFARRRGSGGRVELLLLERRGERRWECLARPGKKLKAGAVVELDERLTAEVLAMGEEGRRLLRFSEPVEPHLDRLGHVPLPPYIHRSDEAADRTLYQTVFARRPGAVAAPTAGLHFSDQLLSAIEAAGVELATVTLHVGIGTFRPVTAERVEEHRMDGERYTVPAATAAAIARLRRRGGRLVAVGTTVVRTLETAALAGGGEVAAGSGVSELFITPGFTFQAVDRLLTNFHLPRSTLLMLVSAFAGRDRVLAAYREAVERRYRFYSYGDAMLLDRA